MEKNIAQSWKDARDAPVAVESFSDGSRREAQEKGIVLEKEKRELQAVVSNLKTFDSDAVHASVEVGALVQASREGREAFYFIVASFGGDSFKVQGKTVFTLSQESPLGQALLGKKQEERIFFNSQEILILEIQ